MVVKFLTAMIAGAAVFGEVLNIAVANTTVKVHGFIRVFPIRCEWLVLEFKLSLLAYDYIVSVGCSAFVSEPDHPDSSDDKNSTQ